MPITDLTGTTWLLNDYLSPWTQQYETFNLNITSNNQNFNVLNLREYGNGAILALQNTVTGTSIAPYNAESGSGWENTSYKIITITGGTDATNSDAIASITNNATQQTAPTPTTQITLGRTFIKTIITNASCITNLVGTTWVFNEIININPLEVGDYEFSINYYLTNDSVTSDIKLDLYSDNDYFWMVYSNISQAYDSDWGGWQNENFKSITITGGDDATNSDLISFLWTNATLTSISNVRGKTFILNENFDNMPLNTSAQHNIFFTNSNINETCNSIQYSKYYDDLEDKTQMYINYYYNGGDYIQPYNLFATNSGWWDQSYRTVTILDSENIDPFSRQDYGADSDTVAFFQNYAQLNTSTTILQPVTIVQKVASSGLTGTTWVINTVSYTGLPSNPQEEWEYNINFTSNNTSYSLFYLWTHPMWLQLEYDTTVAKANSWSDEAYKTITITGGTDATNSDLISWLQANATLISSSSETLQPVNLFSTGVQTVESNYLTFSSPDTFTLSLGNNFKMWDGTLEYSIDATNWDTWTGTSAISSSSSGTTKYLYLRGTNNTIISGQGAEYGYGNWVLTGTDIRCDGNIENLLDYQTVANGNHPTMGDSCFKHMFKNQSALISTPSLPAIILSHFCYGYMFNLCSNLVTIPELPATTLTEWCYYSMFGNCSKIKLSTTQTEEYTQPYRLPTSGTGIIADYALGSMFHNTGGTFTEAPELNTTYYLSNTNTIIN